MRPFYFAVALVTITGSAAFATMPTITDPPKLPSERSCGTWASNQDEEAITIWGIQEDGSTSRSSALARLSASCQGYGTPEIVGFGTSASFDEAFCLRHSDYKICKTVSGAISPPVRKAECVVDDPTSTLLNYRTVPYGRILGKLDNGEGVSVLDTSMDAQGKPWVFVADQNGKALGWVFRSYIVCR